MSPTLVLFDIDGTLVDTAGAGKRAMGRAFRDVFGVPDLDAITAGVRFAGMTDLRIIGELVRAAGLPGPDGDAAGMLDALTTSYVRALRLEMARPRPDCRVLPGVEPLLIALEERPDAHLGLITGNLERGARAKLEPFDLNRYFPAGGYGSDHADRREVARIACARLSTHAGVRFAGDRVIVIGDTELDVDCARANGFRSVAVCSGWVSRATLERSRPDVLLDDLADLPRVLRALELGHRGNP